MTKQEFDNIVNDAVKGGADREAAEAYVTSGFKLPVDAKGKPVFEGGKADKSETKKTKG